MIWRSTMPTTRTRVFLTSTSLCLCPVRSINGVEIADGKVPGPGTAQLIEAFKDLVGYDFVAQHQHHANQ